MPMLDPATQPDAIERAAQRLADGGLLALPTETVYGLGARADDDAAVARIFAAKGRPADHPLIVHVPNPQAALHFVSAFPPVAQRLTQAFWPGPLTVIVPRDPRVATAAAGGHDTIGLRCPSHPVARQLLDACAQHGILGVAAPSANRFGRISPTTAQHVREEFEGRGAGLDEVWVLDGGACEVGIESTIIDCSRGHPVLLSWQAVSRILATPNHQGIRDWLGSHPATVQPFPATDPAYIFDVDTPADIDRLRTLVHPATVAWRSSQSFHSTSWAAT